MSEQIDNIRYMLYKHGVGHVNDMSDEHVIEIFNEELEDAPYWFCKDCHQFHSKQQLHCSLPCVREDIERDITEEEYEQVYGEYDPRDYSQDDDHLQFPHTRFANWMNASQRYYNLKILRHVDSKLEAAAKAWKCRNGKVNINDMSKPMTRFEQALRKFEIKRYNGWKMTGAQANMESLLDWALQTAPQ